MSDLEISTVFNQVHYVSRTKRVLYGDYFLDKYVYILCDGNCVSILVYSENREEFIFEKNILCSLTPVKIVGSLREILALSSDGSLQILANDQEHLKTLNKSLFKWIKYNYIKFKKVLTVTHIQERIFAFLLVDENGNKKLKIFNCASLSAEDYTFDDLNSTQSDEYDLYVAEKSPALLSIIIYDKFSGKIYLWSKNNQSRLIYCSKFKLISVIPVKGKKCLLLCFENGKILIHFFPESSSDRAIFLNKRIVCIVNCFCSEGCLLWSDGAILHHTEINFDNPIIKMTNFKVQNNITGILTLVKCTNQIIAGTINNIIYSIKIRKNERKELVQTPGEILSQIYNESLKINDIQNNLRMASYYMNCKEIVQKNQVFMIVESEGGLLNIKNKSKMTLKKEFWTIELKMSDQGCEHVKIVELDTDMVTGMILKFKNPFDNNGRVRVYLSGNFEWDTLSICIGVIQGEDLGKKNLKKKLDEIKVANEPREKKCMATE